MCHWSACWWCSSSSSTPPPCQSRHDPWNPWTTIYTYHLINYLNLKNYFKLNDKIVFLSLSPPGPTPPPWCWCWWGSWWWSARAGWSPAWTWRWRWRWLRWPGLCWESAVSSPCHHHCPAPHCSTNKNSVWIWIDQSEFSIHLLDSDLLDPLLGFNNVADRVRSGWRLLSPEVLWKTFNSSKIFHYIFLHCLSIHLGKVPIRDHIWDNLRHTSLTSEINRRSIENLLIVL